MTTPFDREFARVSAETLRDKRLQLSGPAIPAGRGWEPCRDEMTAALGAAPVAIGHVIDKLRAVQSVLSELPPGPGANRVAAFNGLYLKITERVAAALADGVNQPEFLEILVVEFAKRYFAALELWNSDDDDTPDAWQVLFKRAGDTRISRLVAATLGVNAHLNHDLALALIDTWAEAGAPEDDLIHPDYLLVNEILREEIPPLRQGFSSAWQMEIDEFVGPLDEWSRRVLVAVARAGAWDQARRLWLLRHDPDDLGQARCTMDRAAALLGEWVIFADRVGEDADAGGAGAGGGVTSGWHLLQRALRRGSAPIIDPRSR